MDAVQRTTNRVYLVSSLIALSSLQAVWGSCLARVLLTSRVFPVTSHVNKNSWLLSQTSNTHVLLVYFIQIDQFRSRYFSISSDGFAQQKWKFYIYLDLHFKFMNNFKTDHFDYTVMKRIKVSVYIFIVIVIHGHHLQLWFTGHKTLDIKIYSPYITFI